MMAWAPGSALALISACALSVLLGSPRATALNPALDVSQYAHTAWTIRDGFSPGTAFAMAQTPDGYLWLGGTDGLYRSDGERFIRWQPPAGQHLPHESTPYSLLVTRDGTLWIGTFEGLVSWKNGKLTQYPELDNVFVTSLLEDREGTVWVGVLGYPAAGSVTGRLCAIRSTSTQCHGQDGAFDSFVWSLGEDSSGTLWAGAESGLWRWKPGPPKRYEAPGRLADLALGSDGRLIIGMRGGGLRQLAGDKLEPYPIRSPVNPDAWMPDHDVNSNKLLRDRDGGLWIGTDQRGLVHVHHGRTDVFAKADGLSSDIIAGIFEDREGDIWVSTAGGLDRFREYPITTVSSKQGLSSDNVHAVLAAQDGSIWIASGDGLNRVQNGKTTIFRRASGLPDDAVQSLYQDDRGRIWVFTNRGLASFNNGRFVAADRVPSTEVYSITGDKAGNLWLSGNKGLSHMVDGRMVETFPWTVLGRSQQAKVILSDRGGLWLGFWTDGGVEYFKDGKVRVSYTAADGLGKGHVSGLRLDLDGALWAATEKGLSRIKDGRITTLTTSNVLPCETVHWSSEDEDRSLWIYTACGLVRVRRSDVEAWVADPKHRVEMTAWDAADGAMPLSAPSVWGPTFARSTDDKLWFTSREAVLIVNPRHLAVNTVPPPVHIEQVVADNKTYWQNLPGATVSKLRLPARTHDLQIYYTALSLVAPEKVHFKYKLEGQDADWREAVNDRDVQYSNLGPETYRFRVIASNNSGVWNEQGDTLEFSVAPAYYQTNWFRVLCAVLMLALTWAIYQFRVRQLHREFALTLEARVEERTRVAREIHDTLLQSSHGLVVQLEVVSQMLPNRPVEAKQRLDRTIDRAARTINEGRDAVQGLRESTVQSNDLARAINTVAEELAADPGNHGSPGFQVTVEGEARDLHPILRDEVYRIATEALRNAFRHAQARHVEVEIRYDDRQFRLRVRDDGRGMDASVLSGQGPSGHYGLPGMRERAKVVGGELEIWSEVDAGTEVELRIPSASAYTTAPKRSWWSQFLARNA